LAEEATAVGTPVEASIEKGHKQMSHVPCGF